MSRPIARVAFRHNPIGVDAGSLRAKLALARQRCEEIPDVTELSEKLTRGSLRHEGGAELVRSLADTFGKLGATELVLIWLVGIRTDDRHGARSLPEIAQMVQTGDIRVADYRPLPQRQVA